MIKDLIKIANRLDSIGLFKEADMLDEIIKQSSELEETFEKRTVDEVIDRLNRHPDPGVWKSVKDDIQIIVESNGNSNSEIMKIYPNFKMKDFRELYRRMGGKLPDLNEQDILSLLKSHLDPNSFYMMSPAVKNNIRNALNSIDIKYDDLNEEDKKVVESGYNYY